MTAAAHRSDIKAVLCIAGVVLTLAAPQLAGYWSADPLYYVASVAFDQGAAVMRGVPYIDPNNGATTQALGHLAASDWLRGIVPWWNPYSGVGLPLAGEYQPAAFFPLTLLLLLPRGMAWMQVALEILAGWGTYALLRRLGVGRLAATTGALLFAFNGTLAWFSHAPAGPVPFLPWLLYAIERARARAAEGLPGGWRLVAVAMGMSLLAGFPETAYLDGLFALAWTIVRGFQLPAPRRIPFALRVAAGGLAGVALAAPQILAFVQYLPLAHVGPHGDFAHWSLPSAAAIPSLLAPYAFGPIFGFHDQWPLLMNVWGSVGGYATLLLIAAAALGLATRREALGVLLAAWIALALAKTFGIEPAVALWNWVPGIPVTAFFRYAQPSWELALVILAAWGVDGIAQGATRRGAWAFSAAFAIACAAAGLAFGAHLWPHLALSVASRNFALISAFWAVATMSAFLVACRLSRARAALGVAILLVADSMLMFVLPAFSNTRGGRIDLPAIAFLRENLGLQRFFSLGPINANYGAYFGIASINHNYLPLSQRWGQYVKARLDTANDDVTVFDGRRSGGPDNAAEQLRRNVPAYEEVGVKYVVVSGNEDPFGVLRGAPDAPPVKRVYADVVMGIYELPDPKPYFGIAGPACEVLPADRTRVSVRCEGASTLIRRELFHPGWTATVNGRAAEISEHEGLFQALALPAGASEVRFSFAPPHVAWAWLAAAIAAAALATGGIRAGTRRGQ